MKFQIVFCFCILIFAISCKPAATLRVLQPAQIIIPEHIQKIVLIDRSKPSNGFLNNLEGLFSGEDYQQDKEGRRTAMDGLSEILRNTPRFETIYSNVEMEGSRGGRSYMPPLTWYEIAELCKRYGGDAIVAIEMFDSNVNTQISTRVVKEKDKNGNQINRIVYDGRRDSRVNLGWRFYDPKNKSIVDEYQDTDTDNQTSSSATTDALARQNIKTGYEMIRASANKLGRKYGQRIAPAYITLSRSYFKKAKGTNSEKFGEAARYADAGEWDRAVSIWTRIAGIRSDKETAGLATYNLAVASEVKGQLNTALQYARDAYTLFGEKKAKSYIRILERRLEDQEILGRQMHEKGKT